MVGHSPPSLGPAPPFAQRPPPCGTVALWVRPGLKVAHSLLPGVLPMVFLCKVVSMFKNPRSSCPFLPGPQVPKGVGALEGQHPSPCPLEDPGRSRGQSTSLLHR